ncbi:hypothetical protein ACIBEF_32575 [Micromonospora sp. NPDC050795]|uniref:hypothetical protein n=1 Tax=Micromonospora sp. NPDC050795 TaxID=3364282 RepID=UPI0037919F80
MDISAANLNDHLMFQDMIDGMTPVRQPPPAGRGNGRANSTATRATTTRSTATCCEHAPSPRGSPVKRIDSSARLGQHRYVIERCLEWTTRFRRLVRRYDRTASHFLGLLHLACAVICYRRAIRLNLVTSNNPN